jgi:hypothetical protein
MKKFTEIGQFRNVIRSVKSQCDYAGKDENGDSIYIHSKPYPILKFRGTVKLHGTNSAIVKYKNKKQPGDEVYHFQSRERVLCIPHDNTGFMLAMMNKPYKELFDGIEFEDNCCIYGEWCGGSIQKKVALNQVDKMFVIFAIRIDDVYQDLENYKHLHNNEEHIFNILQFPHYDIEIDFNQPEIAQSKIVDMTIAVEDECPAGKFFGVSGVGEGLVFESNDSYGRHIFKSKGEKHQNSKVKKLATVDTEEIGGLREFVDYAVTENRMQQGIDKMIELGVPLEMKSTGEYLRWVYNDVIKEEMDTIVKNQIDPKKVGSYISTKARMFWVNYLNSIPL